MFVLVWRHRSSPAVASFNQVEATKRAATRVAALLVRFLDGSLHVNRLPGCIEGSMHANSLAFVLLKLLLMVNVVRLSRGLVLQHVLITRLHNGSAEGLRVGGRSRGLPLRIGRRLSSLIGRAAGLRL